MMGFGDQPDQEGRHGPRSVVQIGADEHDYPEEAHVSSPFSSAAGYKFDGLDTRERASEVRVQGGIIRIRLSLCLGGGHVFLLPFVGPDSASA